MDGNSLDIKENDLNNFRKLFPQVFKENKVDFALLKVILGDDVIAKDEAYTLSWAGKLEAFKEIQKQTTATLIPDRLKSVDFDEAENIFIEGENLEVLRVLQRSYYGKIKMIYIDPPYNTGNDSFVYPDDYTERKLDYDKRAGIINEEGFLNKQDLWKKNTKENGQYHSVWLSMMYPRLFLAKNLLREDGVIFVSIDESEAANLKLLMNEIFHEENFRNIFVVRRYDKNLNRQFIDQGLSTFNIGFEYILCYAKSEEFSFNPVYKESSEERQNFGYWKGFWNDAERPTMRFDILGFEPETGQWKWSKDKSLKAVENYIKYVNEFSGKMSLEEYWSSTGKILDFIRRNPEGKGKNKGVENWIPPTDGILRNTNWTDLFASKIEPEVKDVFDYPKNIEVLKNLISISESDNDDIILDFFCGSASTAHAVFDYNKNLKSNKKFICVQIPEVCDKDSEAYKKGLYTIADVSRFRINNVIESLKAKEKGKIAFESNVYLNYKAFTLCPSNFKIWNNSIDTDSDLLKQLDAFKTPQKESLPENILFELILKLGYSLIVNIQKKDIDGCEIFVVGEGEIIFLIERISSKVLDFIKALKPIMVFCLDIVFNNDDQLKTNTQLQLKELNIQFKTI